MADKIKLAVISDSPRKPTGFGTVNAQLCMGFHEAGLEVHALGLLDTSYDSYSQVPYRLTPVSPMDDLAHSTFGMWLQSVKPDVIFFLTDAGNLSHYMQRIIFEGIGTWLTDKDEDYIPPVVAYVPIEGQPMQREFGQTFDWVVQTGGTLVVYCEEARRMVEEEFSWHRPEVVEHGLDHGPFEPYSPEARQKLRKLAGLDDYFVVGAVGVNKQTKMFIEYLKVAVELKKMGKADRYKFYLHTNPDLPTMHGYKLKQLVDHPDFDVADMFLFKQVSHQFDYWHGVERFHNTLGQLDDLMDEVPPSANGRGFMFANYDFVSLLNCLDVYLDLSGIEGWGLPPGEAMKCGIPTLMVDDRGIRRHIYSEGVYMLESLPKRLWPYWFYGPKIAVADPAMVAISLRKFYDNPSLKAEYALKGRKVADRYNWQPSKEKMAQIVVDAYKRVQ